MSWLDPPEPPELPDCPECQGDNVYNDHDEVICRECGHRWTPLTADDIAAIKADMEYDRWKDEGGLSRRRG